MRRLHNYQIWVFAILIAVSVCLLRLNDWTSHWSFSQFLMRSCLVGLLCCCAAWWSERDTPLALQTIFAILLALVGVFALNLRDAQLNQLWFCSLFYLLICLTASNSLLNRLSQDMCRFDHASSRHRPSVAAKRRPIQFSLGTILSVLTSLSIIQATMFWVDLPNPTKLAIALSFGCCGILTSINIWCSNRFENSTAATISIVLVVVGSLLLRLVGLSVQDWLAATFFLGLMQAMICSAVIVWPLARSRIDSLLLMLARRWRTVRSNL